MSSIHDENFNTPFSLIQKLKIFRFTQACRGCSIGRRETASETIQYHTADGPCRLRVEEILYQLERWMRKNLVVRE